MVEWRSAVLRHLAGSGLSPETEADVADELVQHLEDRYAELLRRGLGADEAEAAVLAELQTTEAPLGRRVARTRGRSGSAPAAGNPAAGFFGGLAADVRYAARTLRRSPGYAAVVILTLALGIGVVSAAQAVIDPLLLRPLAFGAPERLVTLDSGVMPGEYEIIRERTTSFEITSLHRGGQAWGLSGDGEAERLIGAAITPEFFTTLRVQPLLGVLPDVAGVAQEEAAVLSYELWQRRFGGDRSVVGSTIRLEGRTVPVIAVMPRGIGYPTRTELWLAKALDPANVGSLWGIGGFYMVGRLRDGASPAAAQAEIRALSASLSEANPFWTPAADYRAEVRALPLHDALVGDVRQALLLLGGAVALLLLIACANVANLVLARGFGRARELAVRTALGASGVRIVRQILTETLVLALAGGAAGVALAVVAVNALRAMLPPDLPRLAEIGLDARVLALSLAVTVGTGLLLGVLPALRATRFRMNDALRDGTRAFGDRSGRRLSGGLVVAQVALAVLLVTGAGLLGRSLLALQRTETGIGRMEVVTARIDLPAGQYGTSAARHAWFGEVLPRLAALPGVSAAAFTSQVPFSGHLQLSAMLVENVTPDPNDLPVFVHRRITPEFFGALGIPLLRGRLFTAADMAADGAPVAIVDETAAREFWPGEDPIGRRLGRPWMREQLVVVGVVGAVLDGELAGTAERTVYTPLPKEPPQSAFIVLGSATGASVVPALRAALRDADPTVPLSDVGTVSSLVRGRLSARRLSASLLAAFGVLALTLAAIGIYGVLAYAVSQRGRELALRLALGANARDVLAMVFREGMLLALLGAAIGVGASLALSRVLRGVLHGVQPHDPLTIAGVTLVVMLAAAAAVAMPALRASRVQPMHALRE
jgi:putative ABC transport system permease protein